MIWSIHHPIFKKEQKKEGSTGDQILLDFAQRKRKMMRKRKEDESKSLEKWASKIKGTLEHLHKFMELDETWNTRLIPLNKKSS